jgi:hypothetical protein
VWLQRVGAREVEQPAERGIDALRRLTAVLGAHPWRVVVTADGHAGDAGMVQAGKRSRDEGSVVVGGRRGVEEIAQLREEQRAVLDGILGRRRECLTQALAPLRPALGRETWQRRGEMAVAGEDDAHGPRRALHGARALRQRLEAGERG